MKIDSNKLLCSKSEAINLAHEYAFAELDLSVGISLTGLTEEEFCCLSNKILESAIETQERYLGIKNEISNRLNLNKKTRSHHDMADFLARNSIHFDKNEFGQDSKPLIKQLVPALILYPQEIPEPVRRWLAKALWQTVIDPNNAIRHLQLGDRLRKAKSDRMSESTAKIYLVADYLSPHFKKHKEPETLNSKPGLYSVVADVLHISPSKAEQRYREIATDDIYASIAADFFYSLDATLIAKLDAVIAKHS